jgi:putative hydrolase of the HAD superfamily
MLTTDAIDATAYWQGVAQAAGLTFTPQQIQELALLDCRVWERPNPVMMEWGAVLREQGFKTPVLSNMSRTVGDYFRRTGKWVEQFHPVCFSGEMKMAKPDAEIYRACLEVVGVPASQAILIDDREVNIVAGRAVGIQGIVFRSAEELGPELEPFGLAETLAEAKVRAE